MNLDGGTWAALFFYIVIIGGVSVWALVRCLKNNKWEES